MADKVILSVRLNDATSKRLARIAKATRRSQSSLAAEAIEAFVAIQDWQIAGIHQALDSLERGEGVPHREVKKWADSLGTDEELPKPKSR